MRTGRLLHVFALAVLGLSASFATDLRGTILDAAGHPIPQSRVTAFARDSQQRRTTVADDEGRYTFPSLAAGQYLIQAEASGMGPAAVPFTLSESAIATSTVVLDLKLDPADIRTQVVVTATGATQSTDETAKSVDILTAADLEKNAEFSVTEALRSLPGMRIQTLGGPGSFTRIVTRGLRPQDTAIAVDGLRFRDAATTQGDATPFLQDMVLLGSDRIEVLRGTGSSVYGSHAIGGVVNLVSDTGGGPFHGEVKAEGGGLGMMHGLARAGGGLWRQRLHYSAALQSLLVNHGVDGNDAFRNHSTQDSLQFRPSASSSLTGYFWAADSFAQINSTPFAAPTANLPARGVIHAVPVSLAVQKQIEAGLPFSYSSANFVPNLNDPDSTRAAKFLWGPSSGISSSALASRTGSPTIAW